MKWYYTSDGQQQGPVEQDELFAMGRDGRLAATDYVWNETMGETWSEAAKIPDLIPASAQADTTLPAVATDLPAAPAYAPNGTGGMTPNAELMARARESLSGLWGLAIGVFVVAGAISVASSIVPGGSIVTLIITGPITLGLATFSLVLARRVDEPKFGMLFSGFSRFGTALGAYLLMTLFVLLWMMLLIIPGIIASYAYAMTFYIIADDPTVGPLDAIGRSKEMMRGNKWKFFCLSLRFIGWFLLCMLTCGIGFIWLQPYIMMSVAHFYEDIAMPVEEPTTVT